MSRQHLSISVICQLLLTRFWPNFKGRFLGPSLTHNKCQCDICPGNICPRNVNVTFVQATYVPETFVLFRNILAITDQILTKLFGPNFGRPWIFFDQTFFGPKFCLTITFVDLQTFFYPNIFLDPKFCGPKILWTQNFFGPKYF